MSKALVYMIDDDPDVSSLIERRCLKFGCDIKLFATAEPLFAELVLKRPTLLIVDLNLGEGMTGFDVIRKVRAEFPGELPIVILSGDRAQNSVSKGLELGANDFLVKPPGKNDFEEMLALYTSAAQQTESATPNFLKVDPNRKAVRLGFKLAIQEVRPDGMTLISDHLVKKGASFYLVGPELQKISLSCDKLFVSVTDTSTALISGQKKHLLTVKITSSQKEPFAEIKEFLNTQFAKLHVK